MFLLPKAGGKRITLVPVTSFWLEVSVSFFCFNYRFLKLWKSDSTTKLMYSSYFAFPNDFTVESL